MNRKTSSRRQTAAAAILALASVCAANANTIYVNGSVATTGNGSSSSPYKTVHEGVAALNSSPAPSTLLIAGNCVYTENTKDLSKVTVTVTGTSTAPYLIDAYNTGGDPSLNPQIQGYGQGGGGNDYGLFLKDCVYTTVRNLRTYNHAQNGISVRGTTSTASAHNVVEYCSTDNTGKSGIGASTGTDISVRYCTVERACQWDSQECITMATIVNPYVYGCTVKTPGVAVNGRQEGIDFKFGCHDGLMYNNSVTGIDHKNFYVDSGGADTYNVDVYRNYSTGGTSDGLSVGSEVYLGVSALTSHIRIYNNIADHHVDPNDSSKGGGGLGISPNSDGVRHYFDDIQFYHNTLDANKIGIWLSNGLDCTNLVIKHNIVSNCVSDSVHLNGGWDDNPGSTSLPAGLQSYSNIVYYTHASYHGHWGGVDDHQDPHYAGGAGPLGYMLTSSSTYAIGQETDSSLASFIYADFRDNQRGATARDRGAFEYDSNLYFEAEDLDVASFSASNGGTARNVVDSQSSPTGITGKTGAYAILDSHAVGDSIVFRVPGVPLRISPQYYKVYVAFKKFNTRGTFQLSASPAGSLSGFSNIGGVIDQYDSGVVYQYEQYVGNWSPGTSSDKWFKLTVKGKNASASDYTLSVDYIRLDPF